MWSKIAKHSSVIALIITVAIALGGAAFGVWWYMQKDEIRNQQWYEDDQRWNEGILENQRKIIENQVAIRTDIATLEQALVNVIDRHEEFISTEHRDMAQTLSGLIFQVGVHQGEHNATARRED